MGFEFRVSGFRFWVWGLISCLRFQVLGLGSDFVFEVWGLGFGFWVWGLGVWGVGVWGLGFDSVTRMPERTVWVWGLGVWGLGFDSVGYIGGCNLVVQRGEPDLKLLDEEFLLADRGLLVWGFHMKCVSLQKISGNEVYYTMFSILLVKIMLCSKLYSQKYLRLKQISHHIGVSGLGLRVSGSRLRVQG